MIQGLKGASDDTPRLNELTAVSSTNVQVQPKASLQNTNPCYGQYVCLHCQSEHSDLKNPATTSGSAHPPRRTFRFDESSLSSSTTSSSSPLPDFVPRGPSLGELVLEAFPDASPSRRRRSVLPPGKTVQGFCLPSDVVASATVELQASSSQLPTSVPPGSDDEEVVSLIFNITKTLALKANRYASVEYIKGLIQDKEQIDGHSVQLSFKGNPLEDGQLLADYGIRGHAELDVILQDPTMILLYVNILSTPQRLLLQARDWDTVGGVKLMIQAEEGTALDEFDLLFAGKLLSEERTLASLDLPPKPTFHLVPHPRDDLSLTVDMSGHTVTLEAKVWYTVGHLKSIAASMMSVQEMSLLLAYQGKQLEDRKALACYGIGDRSLLQLVSRAAPFFIFVQRWDGKKTVALQVSRSDSVEEVKKKLLHELQVSVWPELHHIAYGGKRLADDRDLASYGIQENATLFEIISTHGE